MAKKKQDRGASPPITAGPAPTTEALLQLHVQPGAAADAVFEAGGAIRVVIAATADRGAANKRLVKFLSRSLGVPQADIAIVGGAACRDKRVRVAGLPEEECLRRLALLV
jgi:uncharacterized protein (TIGR00251 family)